MSSSSTDSSAAPEIHLDLPGEGDTPSAQPGRAFRIDKYFLAMKKYGASDVHFKADTPVKFRVKGDIRNLDGGALTSEQVDALFFEIMSEKHQSRYLTEGSTDFAYQLPGAMGERFRINIFRQRGQTSAACRRVPREILNYEQLHLPPVLSKLAQLHQGLILLAGITGSGKSTTIAAMIDQINATRACHIVTIEDPIEFLYEDKKAFINQREVGIDVADFPKALKYLMREDPDVVLIGELRDNETFEAALNAAETGHLVFGTIHASSGPSTIARLLELFPEEARALIRTSLVFNLQAVICQKLLPTIHPKFPRIPAVEIMICNSTIRKLIEEERDSDIASVIRASHNEGMVDFTESLRKLVEAEFISVKTAYAVAPNPDELKMRLKGISVSSGGIIG